MLVAWVRTLRMRLPQAPSMVMHHHSSGLGEGPWSRRACRQYRPRSRCHPYIICGFMKFWLDWEWPAAERALEKAIRRFGPQLFAGASHAPESPCLIWAGTIGRESRCRAPRGENWTLSTLTHCALSAQVAFNARDFPSGARKTCESGECSQSRTLGRLLPARYGV